MKKNIFYLLLIGVVFLFSGCSKSNYSIAPAGSWLDPAKQGATVRHISTLPPPIDWLDPGDLSDQPIDCLLPGEEDSITVYSQKLCEELIKRRKKQINNEALKNQRSFPHSFQDSGTDEYPKPIYDQVYSKERCDSLKFKEIGVWCRECRESLPDKMFCSLQGYYYP
ncbi:hypothetical protein KKC45_03585 [Patescibacteria group bacterium]|nr:hypothetical protein [Patescibacteria group bacterium]